MKDTFQNIATAATVSTATVGAGASQMFDWIPAGIGKLASLVGVILSIVLIIVHIRRFKGENKRCQLDIGIKEEQLKELRAKNKITYDRRASDSPMRKIKKA